MSLDTVHDRQHLPTEQGPFQKIQTILICKNSLVRAGIRHILDGSPFMVAEELEDSSRLTAPPDASPALYILDDSHSADALTEIVAGLKAQFPSAQVVILADHLDPRTVIRALHAGTNGLCSTRIGRDALIKALELVMLGETFIASALVLTMLNDMSQTYESRPDMSPGLTAAKDTATEAHNLSTREAEILRRLMEGESNKVIARKLDVAEATVKVHVKAILRKVRVTNRTQAAMWAASHLSAASTSQHITHGCKDRA
jgi:two-component system nitrate/nitrite response regulator NarL